MKNSKQKTNGQQIAEWSSTIPISREPIFIQNSMFFWREVYGKRVKNKSINKSHPFT